MKNAKWNYWHAFFLNFKLSPITTTVLLLEMVVSGLIPTVQIFAFAEFVGCVTKVAIEGGRLKEVTISLFFVLAILAYQMLIPNVLHLVTVKHNNNIQKNFSVIVLEKSASLEYYHIETPRTLDLISRISENGETKIIESFYTLIAVIQLIARIAGIIGIILAYAWLVAIGILIFSIPLFYLATKSGKEVYNAEVEVANHRRKYEYYSELLVGRDAVDERTLFGYTDTVNKKWEKEHSVFRLITNRVNIKNNIRLEGGSIMTGVITVVSVVFLLSAVFQGKLSSELFISLVIAIIQLVEIMSFNFTDLVNKFTNCSIFFKDMEVFFNLSEDNGAKALPQFPPMHFDSLEFRNVKFRYSEDLPYILNGVSFTIKPGKHYAFVGENGAGKTTIIKLIVGLYDQYEGDILLNGKNIRDYSAGEIKSLISVSYQDFAKYHITLEENILLGALNAPSTDVDGALQLVGLEDTIAKLPQGIKTVLGRIKEGGVDLSGGEWQKIAIARNIVGRGSISILDEPTASLDPLAENAIYEQFEKISKNRTTIFISHRLGSAKLADIIYVIDNGKIVESGTNAELLRKRGLYYDMYEAQRSWYE